MKKRLNPALIYVLSIIGLLCCCFGGLGVLLSGPAYFIADNQLKDFRNNPDAYDDDQNPSAMNTAKIVALVIAIINLLYLLRTIYVIYTVGWDEIMQQSQEMMDQWQSNQ